MFIGRREVREVDDEFDKLSDDEQWRLAKQRAAELRLVRLIHSQRVGNPRRARPRPIKPQSQSRARISYAQPKSSQKYLMLLFSDHCPITARSLLAIGRTDDIYAR